MEQLFKPSVIWDSILAIIPSIPITMLITPDRRAARSAVRLYFGRAADKEDSRAGSVSDSIYLLYPGGLRCWCSSFYPITGYRCCCESLTITSERSLTSAAFQISSSHSPAFSFNEAAYNAETIRASILSVDRRDIEAAHSYGDDRSADDAARYSRRTRDDRGDPESGKQFYQSGKGDVAGIRYRSHGYDGKSEGSRRKQHALFEAYIGLALLYWLICLIFEFIVRKLEKKFNILDREVAVSDTAQEHS